MSGLQKRTAAELQHPALRPRRTPAELKQIALAAQERFGPSPGGAEASAEDVLAWAAAEQRPLLHLLGAALHLWTAWLAWRGRIRGAEGL